MMTLVVVALVCGVGLVIGILVIILVIWITQYNSLVSVRTRVDESWSDVQTELKRRYDLIPNLVKTVKGYAKHERDLLKDITAMREKCMAATGSPAQQAVPEGRLSSLLDKLIVRLENYPDLKASKNFLQLQEELTDTEDRIQASLRFFNANVREMNIKKDQFPSNMVANFHGFKKSEFFEVKDKKVAKDMQKPVDVDFDD